MSKSIFTLACIVPLFALTLGCGGDPPPPDVETEGASTEVVEEETIEEERELR